MYLGCILLYVGTRVFVSDTRGVYYASAVCEANSLVPPSTIYRFHATSIKIPVTYSTEVEKKKISIKFAWNCRRIQLAKAMEKEQS